MVEFLLFFVKSSGQLSILFLPLNISWSADRFCKSRCLLLPQLKELIHVIYEHCRCFLRTKVGVKTTPDERPVTSQDAGEIKYLAPHHKLECLSRRQRVLQNYFWIRGIAAYNCSELFSCCNACFCFSGMFISGQSAGNRETFNVWQTCVRMAEFGLQACNLAQ